MAQLPAQLQMTLLVVVTPHLIHLLLLAVVEAERLTLMEIVADLVADLGM